MTAVAAQRLDFYFDFISMYACFAWRRLRKLCDERDLELVAHPVVFARLLDHWGQLGPAEIPPKRECVFKAAWRTAALEGWDYDPPAAHPYNPIPSLRLALAAVGGADQHRVVDTIFDAGWSRGADLGDPGALVAALDAAGLDGAALLERTAEPAVKDALRQGTEDAIGRGVFGVPTMILGEELFWGNDQIEHLVLCLDGRDPVEPARMAEILARGRGADRAAPRPPHDDTAAEGAPS